LQDTAFGRGVHRDSFTAWHPKKPEGEFIFSKQENFDTDSRRSGAGVTFFVRKFSLIPWCRPPRIDKLLFAFLFVLHGSVDPLPTGPDVNISEQNEQAPLQSVYISWKQVRHLNLLDEIDLLSFRQSGTIG
jgi:hypothetical protein